jgi:hypothetical protein
MSDLPSKDYLNKLIDGQKYLNEERKRMLFIIYYDQFRGETYHPINRFICVLTGMDDCTCTPGGPQGCSPFLGCETAEDIQNTVKTVNTTRSSIIQEQFETVVIALEAEHGHKLTIDTCIQLLLDEYKYWVSRKTEGVHGVDALKEQVAREKTGVGCTCKKSPPQPSPLLSFGGGCGGGGGES